MEWQPIKTAPKDGTRILGFSLDMGTCFIHWQDFGADYPAPIGWRSGLRVYTSDAEDSPTHWMPLPPPPSAS